MRLDEKMRRSVASGTQERAETKEKLPKSFLAIVYASCGFLGVVWLLLNDWQNDLANQAGDSKSGSSGGESASSPQISIDFSSIIGIRDSQWYQPVKDYLLGWEPWLASLLIFFLVMFIILTVFNIINQFTLPKEKRYGVFENNWAGWGIIGVISVSFVVAISHHSAGSVGKYGTDSLTKEYVEKITFRNPNETKEVIMTIGTRLTVVLPVPPADGRTVSMVCFKLIEPMFLVDSGKIPEDMLENTAGTGPSFVHNYILGRNLRNLMSNNNVSHAKILATSYQRDMSNTICP